MKEASKTASTSFALFCFKSLTTFSSIILVSLSSPTFRLNLLRTLLGYAVCFFFIRHSFLSRKSASSSRVISLRLRTPFMRMTRKVLKRPNGFLGCLPGPAVWKQPSNAFLAKFKSTFLKRVSRVSCSSCPARIHLLSLDVTHLIRDPN
jgi:hypothetical protein